MRSTLRARWLSLLHTLWFLPSLVAVGYIGLAAGLVRLDDAEHLQGAWVFGGSAQAARTVLSVIAGSLITVAGLTFSLTMIVLQLTSSQFSPRVLRNFLGDRVAQLTIGSFIGIFGYCLLALRSVSGAGGANQGVPRLTVTVASALALLALALLMGFIHHIAQLVQASELTARLGRQTLAAVERLHPDRLGEGRSIGGQATLTARWRACERPGAVRAEQPGFVRSVELETLVGGLGDPPARVHLLVAPGDFAHVDQPIAEVWPADRADEVCAVVRRAVTIRAERDIDQDAHFGIRQLTDIALRAISPSVNDPTTAVTCIGYLRAVLTRLASRELPSGICGNDEGATSLVVRTRPFQDYIEPLAELGRYSGGDARVVLELLEAVNAIAEAASAAGARDRAASAAAIGEAVAEQALAEVRQERDRRLVREALQRTGLRLVARGVS